MKKFIVSLVIALIAITSFSTTAIAQSERENGIQIGNILSDITLNNPQGESMRISDLRGNIVFVDFWASWCSPCRRENPVVVRAYKTYRDKTFKDAEGFKIFSISLDKNKADWTNAIQSDGLIWKEHVSDLQGWRSVAAKKYGVRSIPMNFLIDQNGVIIAKNLRGEQLEKTLKNLVEQQ